MCIFFCGGGPRLLTYSEGVRSRKVGLAQTRTVRVSKNTRPERREPIPGRTWEVPHLDPPRLDCCDGAPALAQAGGVCCEVLQVWGGRVGRLFSGWTKPLRFGTWTCAAASAPGGWWFLVLKFL